ncbi:MAG: hypothetical protein R6X20_02115 [Phycisphaerae bacterium]
MQDVVTELRNAAETLEAMPPERTTLFPGWADLTDWHPPESDPKRARNEDVRRAARAILCDGKSADECSYVSYRDLGRLVRYLGDMLEG